MVLRFLLFCILVLCPLSCLSHNVKVRVQSVTSIAKTDDNFICATLDWWPSTRCDFQICPWGEAGLLNLDLGNKILQNAIKAFNPLRIRIGGSLQDQIIYGVGEVGKNCPQLERQHNATFGFTGGCLPMERWDHLNSLFKQTGVNLTFGLNALIGKSKARHDDILWTGKWNSQNARDLMKYSISKGHTIDSYELGNELAGGGVGMKLLADEYGNDVIALKNLVKELYPEPKTRPKVLGPGGFYEEKWFNDFLQVTGPNVLDGVTHHIYNLGQANKPKLIDLVQDPAFLDGVAQTYKDISTSIQNFGAWAEAWVSESGGAFGGGSKDLSHTFADGFWYLDQLGMTSTFNHKVFCRQTLIGGNYPLLNTTTFIPNPDYYGALLWHRLMGKAVLQTSQYSSPLLRTYAHCSKSKQGDITMLLINLSNSTVFNVSVINDMNLYPGRGDVFVDEVLTDKEGEREEYHLTPKDGNIQSEVVLLNGTPLKLTESRDIPEMRPVLVPADRPITVHPRSFVFAKLKGFRAPACY